MTGLNDIRRSFIDFFAAAGHQVVPSSPLVPRNDPTLMFTNAGMVQFKDTFTGDEQRDYARAVSSQKCVRAGGKHNDLDNVGYTARHHTFFEMLGNFSFGDYFKDEAIEFAWRLITKDFALDPKRLTITVFHDDDEAFDIWRKLTGFPSEKIIRIPTSDNFWQMGDTGPCGPSSEIFFDHGPHIPGGPPGSPDEDGDRFIEIWNLVFMQFEQGPDGKRTPLPRPSIDTGMGLERMAAVLQGTHDNYETDLFKSLIAASVEATGVPAEGEHKASHRVIADHLRACSFLVVDGVTPSNDGRGYVLRRIMRRAMRHAHLLGAHEPLLHRLVPALVRQMGESFDELRRGQAMIEEMLKLEETKFKKTLTNGLALLSSETSSLDPGSTLAGDVAFKLYDTYGFPLDLTEDALRQRNISVDKGAFEDLMERQRAEARAAWRGSGDEKTEGHWLKLRDEHGPTDFLGYDTQEVQAQVLALVSDQSVTPQLTAGDEGWVVLNQTPFYAESGGQVGDAGRLLTPEGCTVEVSDTVKRAGDVFAHRVRIVDGQLTAGDNVLAQVDHRRRRAIRCNHTATHILHQALRDQLGQHVAQKGSLVSAERLRFDFSHGKAVEAEELQQIAARANAVVAQNCEIETRIMDRDSALQSGAMALFGEKYADDVRVVSFGAAPDVADVYGAASAADKHDLPSSYDTPSTEQASGSSAAGPDSRPRSAWSVELCGGTHVQRTGDIGIVTIVAESATSSGVRRIEALTGDAARQYFAEQDKRVRDVSGLLKTRPDDVVERLATLLGERRSLEKQLNETRRQLALLDAPVTGSDAQAGGAQKKIGNVSFLGRHVAGLNPKDLRGLVDEGKAKIGSGIVAIVGSTEDGKAGLAVGVTEDLTEAWSAVDLVRIGSAALGGKGGGGRPDMAQAGGPDGSRAQAALDAIAAKLAS
ncbi:MAG: alanine--tRNA ligase [Pseudomonadota bacterium]